MLALALLAFVSYAVSDWTWDVTLLLRAQEVLVGYAVMSPFLLAELELHVIMDVGRWGTVSSAQPKYE